MSSKAVLACLALTALGGCAAGPEQPAAGTNANACELEYRTGSNLPSRKNCAPAPQSTQSPQPPQTKS
jgi:hypothetical protein